MILNNSTFSKIKELSGYAHVAYSGAEAYTGQLRYYFFCGSNQEGCMLVVDESFNVLERKPRIYYTTDDNIPSSLNIVKKYSRDVVSENRDSNANRGVD